MRIVLPFPPTVNNMYPADKSGRRYLSGKGKAFKAEVKARVLEQHGFVKPLTGALSATVELVPPDKRRRDIDNYHKALFDSLGAAGVFEDDSQIHVLHVCKGEPSKESAGAIVTIEKMYERELAAFTDWVECFK